MSVVTASETFELRRRAEQLMRANIAELPDGTYSAEDWLDNDGITDEPLRIALDLTIDGDRMELDFSRSSREAHSRADLSVRVLPAFTRLVR